MVPRRSLRELRTRFKLEPQLDDIFVEGLTDKRILDRGFRYIGEHRAVYSVDGVDVPDDLVLAHELTLGNKQRLIALCCACDLPPDTSIKFLVDVDMDDALKRRRSLPGLSYTKYCDLEGVFFSPSMIEDLVVNAGKVSVSDWTQMFESMEVVVKKIFSIRIALYEIAPSAKLLSFSRCLSKSESEVELEVHDLIRRTCNFKGGHELYDSILERSQHWFDSFSCLDVRFSGRGHDYLTLLSWIIKQYGGSKQVADSLENILVLLVPQVVNDIIEPLGRGDGV